MTGAQRDQEEQGGGGDDRAHLLHRPRPQSAAIAVRVERRSQTQLQIQGLPIISPFLNLPFQRENQVIPRFRFCYSAA